MGVTPNQRKGMNVMCNERNNNCACGFLPILYSVVFAAAIGVLFSLGLIPFIEIATWITLCLSVILLVLLLIFLYNNAGYSCSITSWCLRRSKRHLLAGIIGSLIASIAALSIVLTPIFLSVVILVAIGAFFFMLMITGIINFTRCLG